jgi:hypothetical protein
MRSPAFLAFVASSLLTTSTTAVLTKFPSTPVIPYTPLLSSSFTHNTTTTTHHKTKTHTTLHTTTHSPPHKAITHSPTTSKTSTASASPSAQDSVNPAQICFDGLANTAGTSGCNAGGFVEVGCPESELLDSCIACCVSLNLPLSG